MYQGWGQEQLTKYTKYPKYILSTSNGLVLIFLKVLNLSTSSTFISSTSTSTHIEISPDHFPDYFFVLMSGWT